MTKPEQDEKLIRLIDALLSQTRTGHIAWRTTDDDEAFLYSAANNSIIVNTNGRQVPQPYWLQVINERGTVVASISGFGATASYGATADDDEGRKLRMLHELARRSALRFDAVLDDVIREVENLPPF